MITKRNSSEIPKEVFVLFRVVFGVCFFLFVCMSWGSACPAPGCRIDPHWVCLHAPSPPCKSQIVPIPRCCCHQSPAPSELPAVSLLCPALSQEGPLAREDKLLSLLIIVIAADKLRCDKLQALSKELSTRGAPR